MSLERYNKKRDFKQTSEPKSDKQQSNKNKLIFVIQRHHASHLHYDFRLELDGVLKSWAVPKGPSLNPKDKRLAMMVEDHPFDYKDFEGEIPKGNYGAGTVYIFDKGEYQSLAKDRKDDESILRKGLKDGNIKFKLKGEKLKGEFALVKIKNSEDNAWLLIKHNDEFATDKKFDIEKLIPNEVIKEGKDFKKESKKNTSSKKEIKAIPQFYPMLAKLVKQPFSNADWLFERKFDGYRILVYINQSVKLESRKGKDYSSKYPAIQTDFEKIKEQVVLDTEIVVFDKQGSDDFQLLQDYNPDSNKDIRCFVFDILFLNGHDVTDLPLLKRKNLLEKLFKQYQFDRIHLTGYDVAEGESCFKKAKEKKWEGIMAKKADSEYFPGRRSDSWLKIKTVQGQEAIIVGYTTPLKGRQYFGALVLAINKDDKLVYIGNCGSGFDEKMLEKLYDLMSAYKTDEKPITEKVQKEKDVQWIKPEIICEINFSEWTKEGKARHPVFKCIREDKSSKEVVEETAIDKDETVALTKIIDGKSINLSNLDKLYWPKDKITKGQLIDYYEKLSELILPYTIDKPMSLNRFPNGIDKPGFYQKNVERDQLPAWVKTVEIYSESTEKNVNYIVCNNTASLIFIANLGCIELNPWLSSHKKPEFPEYIVIDIDPDGNPFKEITQVAFAVKDILDHIGVKSYVKTSGSTGLHIYIYTGQKYDYNFCKQFAEFIATKAHESLPKFTSIDRRTDVRKGKVYIDFLQNRRGQTIAAPYSVRPKPKATVSFPLSWEELDKIKISDFNIFSVPDLIKKRENSWIDLKKQKQDLEKALKVFAKSRS